MRVNDTDAVVERGPLIPVLAFETPEQAVQICRILFESGIEVLEITLRTPRALDCLAAVVEDLPSALVGAGTVLTHDQVVAVGELGAAFAVSPGLTPDLYASCAQEGLPLLPGTVSPSEVMRALELGFRNLKFFPAEAYGGVETLSAFAAPLPAARFCPTGGVKPDRLGDYLSLGNVACVGGSWLVSKEDLAKPDASAIGARVSEVLALAPQAGHG